MSSFSPHLLQSTEKKEEEKSDNAGFLDHVWPALKSLDLGSLYHCMVGDRQAQEQGSSAVTWRRILPHITYRQFPKLSEIVLNLHDAADLLALFECLVTDYYKGIPPFEGLQIEALIVKVSFV